MENKYKKKTDRLAYWCRFVQLFRQKIQFSMQHPFPSTKMCLRSSSPWCEAKVEEERRKKKKKKEKNILEILEISRAQERGV